MHLYGPGRIIVDYQDGDWIVTDTGRDMEARTNEAGLVFGIVRGFQESSDEDYGPWYDSGDEDPDA
jgi:hypothetical protein